MKLKTIFLLLIIISIALVGCTNQGYQYNRYQQQQQQVGGGCGVSAPVEDSADTDSVVVSDNMAL